MTDEEAERRDHGADRPAALDELTALAADIFGVPVCAVSLAGRDGEPVLAHDSPGFRLLAGAPIVDDAGHVLGALCLLDDRPHDFTEAQLLVLAGLARQAAHHLVAGGERRELARMKQREADFVATVSHEMRTPITVMQGYLETLADEEELAAYGSLIAPIRRNGDRLVRMVDHLLAGASFEEPSVIVEPGRFDLDCVARAAIGSCLAQAEEAGVVLRLAADSESAPVSGNFGGLSRAVLQLVRNAIMFSRRDDEVVVRVSNGAGPAVEIADRGAGIPSDELPHVTERFYRGRQARDNAVPGVGLGLTIAAEIAEAHGGHLLITSAGRGAGTTVRLTLPEPRTFTRPSRRAGPRRRNRPPQAVNSLRPRRQ